MTDARSIILPREVPYIYGFVAIKNGPRSLDRPADLASGTLRMAVAFNEILSHSQMSGKWVTYGEGRGLRHERDTYAAMLAQNAQCGAQALQ